MSVHTPRGCRKPLEVRVDRSALLVMGNSVKNPAANTNVMSLDLSEVRRKNYFSSMGCLFFTCPNGTSYLCSDAAAIHIQYDIRNIRNTIRNTAAILPLTFYPLKP